jgi:hypothetical protein
MGLVLSNVLAALDKSPSLIWLKYDGISTPPGQAEEQGGLASLKPPNME